jgi:S1-C subfamily serine protease
VSTDTGIVVSADGLVLISNNDIVGSTSVKATLVGSGRTYTARVLGYDATQDVALLQLEGAAHLPAVTLGNSSQLTIGMPVLALGNAQGQGGVTPAAGIISALDRSVSSGDAGQGLAAQNLRGMEQTSAQVGPGDDGGALADSDGRVIGMITTANTSSGQQSTIGFAIPVNTAMAIAREISSGQASSTVYLGEPGFLGVEVKTSTSRDPSGALIAGVIGGTPASRAGLAAGDVITGLNGLPVTTPASLDTLLQPYHSGVVVSVSWTATHGATHTTKITLGNGPFR